MNAFTYSMPAGIPGVANRLGGRMPEIESQIMDPSNPLPFYGLFGQIVNGLFGVLTSASTTAYGALVRPYPAQPSTSGSGVSGAVALGTAAVPPQIQTTIDVLKSGRMTVLLQGNNAGTVAAAVKGAAIYVCIQNPPSGGQVGGITAAADGGNTIALPATSYFMGGADANGNVEIAFDI